MATNVIKPRSPLPPSRIHSAQSREVDNYLRDESKLSAKTTLGVFRPKNKEELIEILSQLKKDGSKITISAARTGVTGGSVPDTDSFVISLEYLTGLVFVDKEKHEITVRSGTSLAELARYIAEELPDYFFPVDPTEQSASIGGATVLNAGGARSLRFGSVRNWIAGLKLVLVDGSELLLRRGEIVAEGGAFRLEKEGLERTLMPGAIPKPNTKNTIGYNFYSSVDLVDLFIGSEGSLGIITELTVRLERRPEFLLTHLQAFKSIETALQCVSTLRSSERFPPYSIEFIDWLTIEMLLNQPKDSIKKFIPILKDANAALFIELPFSSDKDLVEFSEQFVDYLINLKENPDAAFSGTNERTLSDIKRLRHAVPEKVNEIIAERKKSFPELHKISIDMAVPDEKLLWLYELYQYELTKRGFEFVIFGHAGNNHFHTNILPRNLEELNAGKDCYLELSKLIVKAGGSVAAEHGIGRLKKDFLKIQYKEHELEKFKKIKEFFDPEGRLNPHVLV